MRNYRQIPEHASCNVSYVTFYFQRWETMYFSSSVQLQEKYGSGLNPANVNVVFCFGMIVLLTNKVEFCQKAI